WCRILFRIQQNSRRPAEVSGFIWTKGKNRISSLPSRIREPGSIRNCCPIYFFRSVRETPARAGKAWVLAWQSSRTLWNFTGVRSRRKVRVSAQAARSSFGFHLWKQVQSNLQKPPDGADDSAPFGFTNRFTSSLFSL